MNTTQRPTVVMIAAIVLIVLSLFVAGLGIANQLRGGRAFGNRQFVAGQFRNRVGGSQNGSPSNGFPPNGFQNNQNNPGTTPNFIPTRQFNTGLARIFRLIQPVILGFDIVLLALSVVATIGMYKRKSWGATLAIVIAAVILLMTIPSMLRIFSAVVLIENLVRILMAIAVIVLLLLPISRRAFAASVINDEQEPVERIVR